MLSLNHFWVSFYRALFKYCDFLPKTFYTSNMNNAIKEGRTLNSAGNPLGTQTTVPSTNASPNAPLLNLKRNIEEIGDIIQNKEAEKETIANDFPGYLPERYQDNVNAVEMNKMFTHNGWDSQNYLSFNIEVADKDRYIPYNMKLIFKGNFKKSDDQDFPANAIPVEGFYRKLFKKIEIKNKLTNELVNKDVEYDVDIFDFCDNFHYDETAFKHLENKRNQTLCNKVGRRLTVANNGNTNNRLKERFEGGNNSEWNKWAKKNLFIVDMSRIHSFFCIKSFLWAPIEIRLYFNTEMKSLFEVVPAADVGNGALDEVCKFVYDKKFEPSIVCPVFKMSEEYDSKDRSLFQTNPIYDLENYAKVYKYPIKTLTGQASAHVDMRGVKERPEFLIVQISSITAAEHLSHYDNTHEDVALGLIKRLFLRNVNTATGVRTFDIEPNNGNKIEDQIMLYNNFRRLANGACSVATDSELRNTDYIKNFITFEEFVATTKTIANERYPLVIDLTDSLGLYGGTNDKPDQTSPLMQLELIFNQNLTQQYSIETIVITTGKYALHLNDNYSAQITKT